MVKLTKAIIKKYGISKKAWAVARAGRSVSNTNTRRLSKVARRRTRRSGRSRSRSRSMLGGVGFVVAPMLYGAVRQYASMRLAPITSKIPLGEISDEAGMFLTAWALKRFVFKQQGIIRSALTAGQMIEAARVGEAIVTGQVNLGFGGSTSTNGNGYVFA